MEEKLSSAFPLPPLFYQEYTTEAVQRLKDFEESNDSSKAIPEDLAVLKPPLPPDAGAKAEDAAVTYRNLGHIWSTKDELPKLSAIGMRELFSQSQIDESENGMSNRVVELKKLTKSLLIKYLELLGVMGISPERFPEIVEEIRIILINMHHLLNEYHPHQARESLIIMMEEQLERKQVEIRESKAACERMESLLRSLDEYCSATEEGDVTMEDYDSSSAEVQSTDMASQKYHDAQIWKAISAI
ncbi:MED7 protein-domain-containing protein [Dipodascopsis uninucleata]